MAIRVPFLLPEGIVRCTKFTTEALSTRTEGAAMSKEKRTQERITV